MPGANFVLDKGYQIESASSQFLVMKYGSGDQKATVVTGTNDVPLGILLETLNAADVTNERICDVRLMGIATCIASGAITRGTRVRAHSSGKVVAVSGAAGTVDNVVGIAMETAADADWFHVLLTPGVTVNTAVS
jgi:hypothetical protein